MPPEEVNFQAFFIAKIKDRGISLKKLSEATGIAPGHLENIIHGKFDELPSAPYLHGYLLRLGRALDFDGEAWWEKLKKEGMVQNSGSADILPSNRFLKRSPAKFLWIGVVVVIIIIYLAFQLPIIFGKPTINISVPDQNPFTTASSTFTIEGSVRNADSLSLNSAAVTIAADGSWQETVLLQNGPNSFNLAAKKLLGGETDVALQIFYQGPAGGVVPVTSSTKATSTTASTTAIATTTATNTAR